MTTPIQNLEQRIARLEETHPNSRLLQDYKTQLAEYKRAPQGSATETYFSGRPMEPTAKSQQHPMQSAVNLLEHAYSDPTQEASITPESRGKV